MKTLSRHLNLSRKAIILLISLCFATAQALADKQTEELRSKADMLHAQGKNDSAMIVAGKVLDTAVQRKDTVLMMGMHSSMGVYLRTSGKTDEALEHYNEAMRLCSTPGVVARGDEEAVQEAAILYLNIATLHIDMKNTKQALSCATTSAGWAAKSKDKALQAQLYSNIGSIYLMAGDAHSAMKHLERSYTLSEQTGQHDAALTAVAYIMGAAHKVGDAAAANKWDAVGERLLPVTTAETSRLVYYQVKCALLMNNKEYKAALPVFDKILSMKCVEGMPFVQYDCYNNMHMAYAALGSYDKAYTSLQKATALHDSIADKQSADNLRELNVKYETKEKELALAQSETRLAHMYTYAMLAAILVIVAAAAIIIYIQRQRRRRRELELDFARLRADTARRLTERYINGLESERTRLARELHDGLCNDLYGVEMKLALTDNAQPAVSMLTECREKARRISHELMPPEFCYATIDEVIADYVEQCATESCATECSSTPEDADWSIIDDTTALEIYRIAQEAVGNAVRHSGATTVSISMHMEDDRAVMTVTDNGRHTTHKPQGIGLRTMNQRAEAVGGSVSMDAGEQGTRVTLTIPLKKQA